MSMVFTCLQIDDAANRNLMADGFCGMITPDQAAFYVANGYYVPSWRFELPDNLDIKAALENCFAAGNYHPLGNEIDWRRTRDHARSISMGDVLKEEASGRLWICAAVGWTELPAPGARPAAQAIEGRDPRQDPQSGDRIAIVGNPKVITVLGRRGDQVSYSYEGITAQGIEAKVVDIGDWRILAEEALVIVAGDPRPLSPAP